MDTQKLAGALTALGEAFFGIAGQLGGQRDEQLGAKAYAPQAAQAAVGREVDADAPNDDDIVEVSAGDLWRLINRSRKMIRLAREGKVPSMEARAPLCRAIKALKQQGLVKKPRNPRED